MKTPIQELIEHIKNTGFKQYPLSTLELIEELELKENKMITKLKTKKMYSQLQDIEEDYKCSCCGHSEFEIKND